MDMIWFNGWLKNTCAEAKRGIIPFSDRKIILRFKSENDSNMPVMYDDKNPILYAEGTMYPIVALYEIDDIMHHNIVATFEQYYGNKDKCGVEAYVSIDNNGDGGVEEPYIYVEFKDSEHAYHIYNNGDWDMR